MSWFCLLMPKVELLFAVAQRDCENDVILGLS